MEERQSKWLNNLKSKDMSREPYFLGQTMNSMLEDLMKYGPDYINESLLKIKPENAHMSHLMAVLRGLYSWRNQLSNWIILRDKIVIVCHNRNINTDTMLKGLLN